MAFEFDNKNKRITQNETNGEIIIIPNGTGNAGVAGLLLETGVDIAPLNIPVLTSDPSSPVPGDLWILNSNNQNLLKYRLDASSTILLNAGAGILFSGTTTNNSATEIFLNGVASTRFTVPANSTIAFWGVVSARRTDSTTNPSAAYKIEGAIRRDSSAASTTVMSSTVTVINETNANYNVALSADTTNASLKLDVTGDTGNTVQWRAVLQIAHAS